MNAFSYTKGSRLAAFFLNSLCIGLVLACSTAPAWIKDYGIAFEDHGTKALYGVGIARITDDKELTKRAAETKARSELASQIKAWIFSDLRTLLRGSPKTADFAQYLHSQAEDGAKASQRLAHIVLEFAAVASLQATVEDFYSTGDEFAYVLVRTDINQAIYQVYQESIEQATAVSADGQQKFLGQRISTEEIDWLLGAISQRSSELGSGF